MDLQTPLSRLAGIGPTFARRLERLGLITVNDLINHYPFRYDDFSNTTSILEAQVGQTVTLQGEIWSIKNIFTRYGKVLTQAIFNDGTTPIQLTWFNQSWLTKQIQVGDRLQISGKVGKYKSKISIVAPAWEKINSDVILGSEATPESDSGQARMTNGQTIHTGRLVPVYPETYGVTSKWLRAKIANLLPQVLGQVVDPLPAEVAEDMLSLSEALDEVHFPENWQEVEKARERLGFDELFFIQLATLKVRADWQKKPLVKPFEIDPAKLSEFIKKLPFKLTNAQQRVIEEIISDFKSSQPMNRLVQGEVGSGKTVVAAVAAYVAHTNNLRTLYMAPTEILAFQHQSTLSILLESFGIKVGIYTGSRKHLPGEGTDGPAGSHLGGDTNITPRETGRRSRTANTSEVKFLTSHQLDTSEVESRISGPHVIIGTHALLSTKLATEDVGLVIVDEQQRFGVEQRSLLRSRAKAPHFLTMTATPIPRTVALTLYGDLDLSIIDELPKGRIPVKTYLVPSKKRADAYGFIRKKVLAGGQVYIITPLIEESETLQSAKAAKVEFEKLKKAVFPDLKIGLLHGKLKSREKEQVINDFKDKAIDLLVSTSVVEVGMDVTNATIMVVEGAERFGLAQLHQLRGRVGRGSKESFCFLFTGDENPNVTSRLKNLEKIYDGLKLAELDLKIRGSGEIFGTRQAGRFELKIASFSDLGLIEKTREAARQILKTDPSLDKYPLLKRKLQSSINIMPD